MDEYFDKTCGSRSGGVGPASLRDNEEHVEFNSAKNPPRPPYLVLAAQKQGFGLAVGYGMELKWTACSLYPKGLSK